MLIAIRTTAAGRVFHDFAELRCHLHGPGVAVADSARAIGAGHGTGWRARVVSTAILTWLGYTDRSFLHGETSTRASEPVAHPQFGVIDVTG